MPKSIMEVLPQLPPSLPSRLTLPSPSPGLNPIFMSSFIPIPLLCFSKFANWGSAARVSARFFSTTRSCSSSRFRSATFFLILKGGG